MDSMAKILIVDDNPNYLGDALPMYGYEVDIAKNGVEALHKLTSNETKTKFDLVLLDVMMPKMDGWQTLKYIRNNDKIKTIPIIMITAVNEESKQIMGLKTGADDYITKPFILPNLLARIDAVLRRSSWNKKALNEQNINIPIDAHVEQFTKREKEVISMLAQGASNKEIADKLFVRDVTIKTHLNAIFKKLKVTNRTQAVLLAIQLGIIEKED
ncbi:MAG: response regulator transcription factor [Candidatus Gastranaerophilales bacterium]|nr:response regulator transcription factor [Candidatus Gastranaerophilales bacterium]